MKRGSLWIAAGFLTLTCLPAAADPVKQGTVSQKDITATIQEVLWWFPENTETVIAERGPFTLRATDPEDEPSPDIKERLRVLILLTLPSSLAKPVRPDKHVFGGAISVAIE